MDSVATDHRWLSWRESPTLRQCHTAMAWAVVLAAGGLVFYGIETLLLRSERRFVENPLEIMTRAFGLAHFLIGWLFLLTSKAVRQPAALTRLLALTLLGTGLCLGFGFLGGNKNPLLVLTFFSLFLIHDARDQADLFRLHGEAPEHQETTHLLASLKNSVAAAFIAILASGYLFYVVLSGKFALHSLSPSLSFCGLGLLALLTGLTLTRTARLARRLHGSGDEFTRRYAPLLRVYLISATILLIGSAFGSGGLNVIILIHVTTWMVYVRGKLMSNPMEHHTLWQWIRHSPRGFLTLHLGLAAGFLILFALRVHAWERAGLLCEVLSGSAFPYWSLMHISIAFFRK